MNALSPSQLLALYTWFPLALLLTFLLLIGRFYQRFSGKSTFYRLFAVPMVCFAVAAVRYATIDGLGGDLLGDLAWLVGGVTLLVLCGVLYWRMLVRAGKL